MSEDSVYDNWEDLVCSMQDHVKSVENANIVPSDDPFKRRIGFMCFEAEKRWYIDLIDLKRCFDCMDGEEKEDLRELIMSADKRREFCDELCGRKNV